MTTSMQRLEEDIKYLESISPQSRFLPGLREQLASWKANPSGTAQDLYFSGRPMEEPNAPTSEAHPMKDAMDTLENALKAKDAQVMERALKAQQASPESTTPPSSENS